MDILFYKYSKKIPKFYDFIIAKSQRNIEKVEPFNIILYNGFLKLHSTEDLKFDFLYYDKKLLLAILKSPNQQNLIK